MGIEPAALRSVRVMHAAGISDRSVDSLAHI